MGQRFFRYTYTFAVNLHGHHVEITMVGFRRCFQEAAVQPNMYSLPLGASKTL